MLSVFNIDRKQRSATKNECCFFVICIFAGTASGLGRIAGVCTTYVSTGLPITSAMCVYGSVGFMCMLFMINLDQDTTERELHDLIDRTGNVFT